MIITLNKPSCTSKDLATMSSKQSKSVIAATVLMTIKLPQFPIPQTSSNHHHHHHHHHHNPHRHCLWLATAQSVGIAEDSKPQVWLPECGLETKPASCSLATCRFCCEQSCVRAVLPIRTLQLTFCPGWLQKDLLVPIRPSPLLHQLLHVRDTSPVFSYNDTPLTWWQSAAGLDLCDMHHNYFTLALLPPCGFQIPDITRLYLRPDLYMTWQKTCAI